MEKERNSQGNGYVSGMFAYLIPGFTLSRISLFLNVDQTPDNSIIQDLTAESVMSNPSATRL